MNKPLAAALSLLLLPVAVCAQTEVKTNFLDHSNNALIDEATAKAVLGENVPAKVWKIHSPRNYTFVSQVEGGLNPARTCVVTARVMVLPLTAAMKAPMFRPLPKLTATAYDAAMNSSTEQCKALAKDKLKEATQAVVSSIVKS
jgi:hypothetical protein